MADSFVFNPHKWMGVNFDCSLHFVRDKGVLIRTLTILPAYLETREGKTVTDYRDWGIQLGRRIRALKLWFTIRSYGVVGLQNMIRQHVAWAIELAETISAEPDFEIVTKPNLSLFTFRYVPDSKFAHEHDVISDQLLQTVNDDGFTYLTRTVVNGRPVIRFQIGPLNTTQDHISAAWARVAKIARALP